MTVYVCATGEIGSDELVLTSLQDQRRDPRPPITMILLPTSVALHGRQRFQHTEREPRHVTPPEAQASDPCKGMDVNHSIRYACSQAWLVSGGTKA